MREESVSSLSTVSRMRLNHLMDEPIQNTRHDTLKPLASLQKLFCKTYFELAYIETDNIK